MVWTALGTGVLILHRHARGVDRCFTGGAFRRQLLKATTLEFQGCSTAVRDLEAELACCGHTDIAATIREIQGLEKTKLQLTLDLQVSTFDALECDCQR